MKDVLIEFWSDIKNLENASLEDVQKDILAYLKQRQGYKDQVEEMQKAFATIHGIASETFESPNQLELIRLTAVEHLKGESQ